MIELNQSIFENVSAMLASVDPENKVVALSCIENVDFNENIAYILLLKKQEKPVQKNGDNMRQLHIAYLKKVVRM